MNKAAAAKITIPVYPKGALARSKAQLAALMRFPESPEPLEISRPKKQAKKARRSSKKSRT